MKLLKTTPQNMELTSDKKLEIIFKIVICSSLIMIGCEVYLLMKL